MEGTGSIIWTLGKTTLICWVITCLASIIFWLRIEKKGIVHELRSWPDKVRERLLMTYCRLLGSYMLNCFSVAYTLGSPKMLEMLSAYSYNIIIGEVFIMSGLTTLLEVIPLNQENKKLKNTIWILHSTSLGVPISFFGSQICTVSAIGTASLILLASFVAYTAPKDFYKTLSNQISNFYYIITISSLASFTNIPPLTHVAKLILAINFFGGIILYFIVYVINIQYLVYEAEVRREFDPVYSSAVIYLCTINLYIRLAMCYVVDILIHNDFGSAH